MLIYYDKLSELPLIYEGNTDKREMFDVLMEKKSFKMSHLCYEVIEVQTDGGNDTVPEAGDTEQDIDMIQAIGPRMSGSLNNATIADDLPHGKPETKIFHFIDADQAEIKENNVYYSGQIKIEDPSVDSNYVSLRSMLEKKIDDAEGETIGKVDDIVINSETHQIAGIKVKEKLLERLVDSEMKFIPIGNIKGWHEDHLQTIGEPEAFIVTDLQDLE